MLGIKTVVSYIPDRSVSNYDRKEKFGIDDNFIENKIGIRKISQKQPDEKASDLCVKVFEKLAGKISLDKETIDCVVVVTQNPDYKMPCTAAIVHGKLKLPEKCACFDVALGCSGYVYGLSVITAFMKSNDLKNGLLFTSDPFSDIVDTEDKTTALLFGDAATVSLISEDADWFPQKFLFGTRGSGYREIICEDKFFMNGRSVFEFAATTVPKHISELLKNHELDDMDIDKYILHQGSK
jgi:3-oxoacyl-[acyl-carrier-protein] synthase-3